MAHDSGTENYEIVYAKLLYLYPGSYRRRFAEPMLQTFSDLCHERTRSGKGVFWFAVKTYAGTFTAIIKEHSKGAVMSSRATKVKILGAAAGLGTIVLVAGFIFVNNNQPAQSISPGSYLDDARQLSKGKKEACLMDTQQAVDAVSADDGFYEFGDEKISKFEMAAGIAIADVPAGTEYKMTIYSYEDGVAKGAMAYEYGYGIYNYEIKKLPEAGEWELVSTVACERS